MMFFVKFWLFLGEIQWLLTISGSKMTNMATILHKFLDIIQIIIYFIADFLYILDSVIQISSFKWIYVLYMFSKAYTCDIVKKIMLLASFISCKIFPIVLKSYNVPSQTLSLNFMISLQKDITPIIHEILIVFLENIYPFGKKITHLENELLFCFHKLSLLTTF